MFLILFKIYFILFYFILFLQRTIKIQTVEVKCLNKKARKNKILVGNSQLWDFVFSEQKEIGSVGRSVAGVS
jgi:hypothetical protein